jgi:chromosome partitioning protein
MVIDCDAQDLLALRSTLSTADLALLPTRPKRHNLKTLKHLDELVSSYKMVNQHLVAHIVFTQCPSQATQQFRVNDAKRGIRLSVMESEPKGKAADELRSLFSSILESNNAQSPKLGILFI